VPGPRCIIHSTGAEWASERIWTGAENLVPTPGFNTQTVQSVVSCYTRVIRHIGGVEGGL